VCRDDNISRSFDVVVDLPEVNVVTLPVYVQLDLPSVVSVQSSATAVYTIHNRSDLLQDFDVVIESSDAFMFAGHRQVSLVLLLFSQMIFAIPESVSVAQNRPV